MSDGPARHHDDDGEEVDWRLDRVGVQVWWSGPQIAAMAVLTEPKVGGSLCPGRVSVRLDGTWICTSQCSGSPSFFHPESAVADCSRDKVGTCLCWHCLEGALPFRFATRGDFDAEWRLLLPRARQAPSAALLEFVRRCDARSELQPDAARVFHGVERWLRHDGMNGLIDGYDDPALLVAGSPMWALERALCTTAALLERDADIIFNQYRFVEADKMRKTLGEKAFTQMWADLLEACRFSAELAPVVISLAGTSLSLAKLFEAAARAAS